MRDFGLPQVGESGCDAIEINFTPQGEIVTTWTTVERTKSAANSDLADRICAKGFATHVFLDRKRRLWPTPRI